MRTKVGLFCALVVSLTVSCALLPWVKTANDIAQEVCRGALVTREEVISAAASKGYTREFWAEVLCKASDIADLFLASEKPAMTRESKTDRAIAIAKAKGLL
jgi:hypothetical protein